MMTDQDQRCPLKQQQFHTVLILNALMILLGITPIKRLLFTKSVHKVASCNNNCPFLSGKVDQSIKNYWLPTISKLVWQLHQLDVVLCGVWVVSKICSQVKLEFPLSPMNISVMKQRRFWNKQVKYWFSLRFALPATYAFCIKRVLYGCADMCYSP